MVDKYEISLWEDFPDTINGTPYMNERKLCVIGSDTMKGQIRAVEPKMVENINGTHTFTFKMYYVYRDEETNEIIPNPFGSLLINERKLKVYWRGNWYDMLIKQLDEDTSSKSIIYTCKDSFITELSKNGYNLEFSSDLQNNTGTSKELAAAVLEGSGWTFDSVNSYTSIQRTEEAVYEASAARAFTATKQSPSGDTSVTIPSGANTLVFYSSVVGINSTTRVSVDVQFLYSSSGYITEDNGMLVLNGDCYTVTLTGYKSGGTVYFLSGSNTIFSVNVDNGVSGRYRAERLVKSQITKYDSLFDRYVNVYMSGSTEVWGYAATEFTDPLTVVNLVANPSGFTSLDGWIGSGLTYGIFPKFTSTTNITTYSATSYLYLPATTVYNSAISANQQYLKPTQGEIKKGNTGGFHKGDRYIFRVKFKANSNGAPSGNFLHDNSIQPSIYKYNSSYGRTGSAYFSVGGRTNNGDWNEYVMTCTTSCAADQITTLGLFLTATTARWISEVEFFKEEYGVTNYGDTTTKRMNPGEVSLQGISQTVYRYYNPNHGGATTPEAVPFLYEGTTPSSSYIPKTNNYEKLATIEAKQSNRFNILQDIAEAFECWVRFTINHDETGRVIYNSDGTPQKYVRLVEYVGKDLGWSFEYGIDLKNLKRKIVSDQITTKVIVIPNENEFAKNGFCTIARSNLNYTRENFILNLDYFINQGLLDQRTVDRDLYSTSSSYIGYYYNLHALNKEYDEITDILVEKRNELTAQQSELTVQQSKLKALQDQLTNTRSDVMTLACVTTWAAAQAYARTHTDNTKVQSLLNTAGSLQNEINKVTTEVNGLTSSVTKLKNYIADRETRQNTIKNTTSQLHTRFFKKYARYLQEGTWQDDSYIDDNKYYLDAVDVAYTSSRPQIQYEINVMRLTGIEDFSSKVFNVGDLCYIADREYFGYGIDGITPYRLRIIISEITSFFDEPQKDIIKVQNYKTQFDDLFQRITATTQSLQYSQGGFQKAAEAIEPDRTLSFDMLQETFDKNRDIVMTAANQQVSWDGTGITVTDAMNAANKLRLMSGGLFISNDGGVTWKNAVRGDGISADILTAGRINTSQIFLYDGESPSFRWDSYGITAYEYKNSNPNFGRFVRLDRFGLYGYQGSADFHPTNEDQIWSNSKFGLTWKGFFLKGASGNQSLEISDSGSGIVFSLRGSNSTNALVIESNSSGITFSLTGSAGSNSLTIKSDKTSTEFKMLSQNGNNSIEISTSNDIVLKTGNVSRVIIGRLTPTSSSTEYGIWVRDSSGNNIFNVSSNGTNSIGGWTLTSTSFYHTSGNNTIGLYSSGSYTTIQGNTDYYYIRAGSNFGVTIDGSIYANAGKIAGWTINSESLTGGTVTINSNGTISCYTSGATKWIINSDGSATFHNITADGGRIANWQIDEYSIWNTVTGTALNSSYGSSYKIDRYDIVTSSLKASGGSIGGCTLGDSSISGNNWSLTGQGGTIGGWGIGSGSLSNGSVVLNSSGIFWSGVGFSADSDGVGLNGGLVAGNIYGSDFYIKGNLHSLSSVYDSFKTGTSYSGYSAEGYLSWLSSNWGTDRPSEVWNQGMATAYVDDFTTSPSSGGGQKASIDVSVWVDLYGETMKGGKRFIKRDAISFTLSADTAYNTGYYDGLDQFEYVGDKKGSYNRK